ncbi:MAG TPA: hypothetical protein VKE94_23140, partial [Gemmataceae bacterium]|nr:hypothetical protein [Gemmataceae bacterium]
MHTSRSYLVARLALGFALLALVSCGSDPEPETKAAATLEKSASKAVRTKGKTPADSAGAKSAKSQPKQELAAAATKAKAPAAAPAPEQKAAPAKAEPAPVKPEAPAANEEKSEAPKKEGKDKIEIPVIRESFDKAPDGGLPEGWSQWTDLGGTIQLSAAKALSKPNAVACSGGSKTAGRAWLKQPQPADVQVSAAVFVEQLIPAQVLARGQGLDGPRATCYAASVVRGLEVKLQRINQGAASSIATVKSAKWLSEKWVRLTLRVEGKQLAV